MQTDKTPTKPSIETCAALIIAARSEMRRALKDGDEEGFNQSRDAFLRAHRVAYAHGYSPTDLRGIISKVP